jgi:hypothetical protein
MRWTQHLLPNAVASDHHRPTFRLRQCLLEEPHKRTRRSLIGHYPRKCCANIARIWALLHPIVCDIGSSSPLKNNAAHKPDGHGGDGSPLAAGQRGCLEQIHSKRNRFE